MKSDSYSQENPLFAEASTLPSGGVVIEEVSDDYTRDSEAYARKASRCHTAEVASVALLLLAIAVLAIVAYCAFCKRDYASRPAVEKMRKDLEEKIGGLRGNAVFIEKDEDGNTKADSVRDRYIVGYYFVEGEKKNFSLFYNCSSVNYIGGNYTLEDIGGLLYVCSSDKKNCTAAGVEEAYEKPLNITKEVILVGDERYASKEGGDYLKEKIGKIEEKVEKAVDFEKFKEDPDGVGLEGNFTYNGKVYNIYKVYNSSNNVVDIGEGGRWNISIGDSGVELCSLEEKGCLPLDGASYRKVDYCKKEEVEEMLCGLMASLKKRII